MFCMLLLLWKSRHEKCSSNSFLHHLLKAPTTLNQPNFTNWTPLKPSAQSSSFGATAVAVPNSGTVNNSSSSPANENNNTLTTEDKLAKQNVKYDMSTGKVYEELGGSSGNNPAAVVTGASAPPGGTTNCNNATRTRSTLDYTPYGSSQQSYHSAAAASSYPYGNYMSSFSSPYATSPGSYPYDRYIVLLVLTQGGGGYIHVRYTFWSNYNVHKSSCGLCFFASRHFNQ